MRTLLRLLPLFLLATGLMAATRIKSYGVSLLAGADGAGTSTYPSATSATLMPTRIAISRFGVGPQQELMALAVALTTQCPYCLLLHKEKALKAGATPEEIAETTFVAAAIRAGGAITHGTHLVD